MRDPGDGQILQAISQFNRIQRLIPENVKMESFSFPYYDEDADEEVQKLIKPEDVKDGSTPILTNDEKNELEFDEIEKYYFRFLGC